MLPLYRPNYRFLLIILSMFGFMWWSGSSYLQAQELPKQKYQGNDMKSVQGDLLWTTQVGNRKDGNLIYFFFDPVLGLTDMDSHQITEWKIMKSPSAKAIAHLRMPPKTTMEALRKALDLLSFQGNYQTIKITMGDL